MVKMVGRVGFEPTTNWLKANCSTNRANDPKMVGVGGFELPTSCSQSRRATGLRYTPMKDWLRDQDSNLGPNDLQSSGWLLYLTWPAPNAGRTGHPAYNRTVHEQPGPTTTPSEHPA